VATVVLVLIIFGIVFGLIGLLRSTDRVASPPGAASMWNALGVIFIGLALILPLVTK
jgi:uncharacterized membrane protein